MTLDTELLALHGLAVKKMGDVPAVARIMDLDAEMAESALDGAVERSEVMAAKGRYMLTPQGRERLDAAYADACADLRADERFVGAYDRFERINVELKTLMTEWQTRTVGGESVPNDHSDERYDAGIIDRLGQLHDDADPVLDRLADVVPRFAVYQQRLSEAYDRVLAGDQDHVSGVKVDSYHTVWFELHEDLLRLLGRERHE
jgi:hypothetical protein